MTQKYNNIGYSGKIKLSLLKNKTVIKTLEYKNSGSYNLFTFFGNCLQGDYITAKDKRPVYIQGFNFPHTTIEDQGKNSILCAQRNPMLEGSGWGGVVTTQSTGRLRINEKIGYSYFKGTRGSSDTDEGVLKDKVEVYYHFRIPATQIFSSTINMFCLYPNQNSRNEDFSACFLLLTTEHGTQTWDDINISNVADNYNLLIEWTMTIENTTGNIGE